MYFLSLSADWDSTKIHTHLCRCLTESGGGGGNHRLAAGFDSSGSCITKIKKVILLSSSAQICELAPGGKKLWGESHLCSYFQMVDLKKKKKEQKQWRKGVKKRWVKSDVIIKRQAEKTEAHTAGVWIKKGQTHSRNVSAHVCHYLWSIIRWRRKRTGVSWLPFQRGGLTEAVGSLSTRVGLIKVTHDLVSFKTPVYNKFLISLSWRLITSDLCWLLVQYYVWDDSVVITM